MGSFYSGFGGHKSYLGHCEDGIIYSGSGNSTPVGRYENGSIYNQFREHVGSYSGGSIYNASGTHIASYDGGSVYNKYLNAVVGREQVGSYEDNPAEAAALVLLFLGGNFVNSDRNEESTNTSSSTTTYSSNGSSDTGCLSSIFSLISLLIMGILKILFYFYKFIFLYMVFPVWSTATVYYFAVFIISAVLGTLPAIALALGVIETVLVAISIPYWAILFAQKHKKKMTWKETFKYYGKWFIKGPWAYKDIMELKNEPMGD